ncbi:hypothetical protein LSCM1_04975 [Leishmania martiniquensis]|uniref:Serine/threonine specific protein phosphatases domain-containing protein n=1 Tax=Leishmania martiniquensis TaxID=1580590 RepID=A0A836KKI5_9TRYP|nr:hypothetical protein LSCM1_04975 [Leishmania martiniquensis]
MTVYKVSPPRQDCRTGRSQVVVVPRHSGGVTVQWHRDSLQVKVTAGDAAVQAHWVSAARLIADSNSDTVQLTIWHPGLRIYIDGQRVTRIGSPVEVHAVQRISFGTDPTIYTAVPAPPTLIPGADTAKTQPASVPPACPAVACRDGKLATARRQERQTLPLCIPLCSGVEAECGVATPVAVPPKARTVCTTSEGSGCRQERAPREAILASPPPAAMQTSESRGRSPTHAPRSIALMTSSAAEDASVLLQTTEKFAVSAPLTEKISADLLVKWSGTIGRCSADVVDTASSTAFPPICSKADRSGTAVCSPPQTLTSECCNSLAYLCNEVAERRECRGDVPQRICSGALRVRPRLHSSPRWTLDPVTDVCSPDWEALRARHGDAAPPRPHGIYEVSCGSVGLNHAVVAGSRGDAGPLSVSARGRGWRSQALRSHAQVLGAASPRLSRDCRGELSFGVAERISAGPHGECKGMGTRASLLSMDRTATAPSSARSSHLNSAENVRQRPYMREKMQLCPRLRVNPFVVEVFGNTCRYRPLVDVRGTRRSGSSDGSSKSRNGGPQVGVFDRFAGIPWQHPAAADELITPRTEAVLRDVLRRYPDSTAAEADAMFLYCALRRSYDADTDRFSYADAPALTDLICARFSSLLRAVKARMQESRPVLRLSSPLLCGGDLLGSFADLMVVLRSVAYFAHWSSMHTPLLLLGNYVDVGWHSVEVCMLLCCWAYLQPHKVHLLRGPHEDPAVNGSYHLWGKRCLRYKCRQRFGSKKGIALWAQLNDVFAVLPVAAVIDEEVFATHGGVPLLHASPSPGGEEGEGAAWRRQRSEKVQLQNLYSDTSGSPTPTSVDESTSLPLGSRAGGAASAERPTARKDRGAEADAVHMMLFPAPYSSSVVHHRPPTPVLAKARGDGTQEHAQAPETTTSVGQLPLGFLPSDRAHESNKRLWACASRAVATAVAHPTAAHCACAAPPRDSTPIPQAKWTGLMPEGGGGDRTAATAQRAISASASPSSEAGNAKPLAAAQSSNSEKWTSATSARTTSSATSDKSLRVGDGGAAATKDSDAGRHGAYSSSLRLQRGDSSLLKVLADECLPAVAAATESFLVPCATASAARSAQGPDADAPSPPAHALADEDEPSEDDFAALLAAVHTREYAFHTLQRPAAVESRDVRRRLRLVRELLWNRTREAAAKLLMPEEGLSRDGRDATEVPWWRPHRVDGCCGRCPTRQAHRCCLIFGTGALIRFLLRFRFSLLIRGAPEDPSELCGAELSEEGRLLTLNTCRQRGKTALQAAACVVESQTLRLATWGPQELADSLGQLSLSSLPGVHETEAARADFEQFVCDTLYTRLRDHKIVGLNDQWSVLSAYKAYIQHRAAASMPLQGR